MAMAHFYCAINIRLPYQQHCYPITGAVARRAGSLKSAWAQKGKTLSLADMIVAATALEHGLSLMTDNRKDFPLPELRFHPLP
jgi:predicted nucleic acid-binding protein